MHGSAGILGELLACMATAGEQYGLPFLAHADAQPAICMLLMLQVLPSPKAPDQAVLAALKHRAAVQGGPGTRESMLVQIFSTTVELLQVRLPWHPSM